MVKKNGAGRPFGSVNKKTLAYQKEVQKMIDDSGGISPLQYLIKDYMDKTNDREQRANSAKAAAPYCHKKMPMEMQHTGLIEVEFPPMPSRGEMAKLVEQDPKTIEGKCEEIAHAEHAPEAPE